jgi:imidazolonepropionase-like amidohydrolase
MPSNASVVAIAAAAGLTVMTATLSSQSQTIRVHANMLLDGTGKVLRNATIVVQGSKISSIETGNAANVTYNLGQLTIVPGLIDVHAHVGWHFDKDGRYAARPGSPAQEILYAAENAYTTLMAGFTTIQSPGQANDVELREAIARGVLPGPRLLTSIRQFNERSGTPQEIREKVRQLKTDGADVVKIFASASIRDGGKQTMTDEQLQAVCGEANTLGMRTMVHAHSPESIKASVNAGCKQIEHGVFATQEVLTLMAQKGVFFDPNIGVVLQNYLTNKAKFLGIGNYNEEGFSFMEKGLKLNADMI